MDDNKATRRDFLKFSGTLTVAAVVSIPAGTWAEGKTYPASKGYILVDRAKCQGCQTCMLACSLAHHGRENVSLSRIQILQDPYGKWPDDIKIEMCRQCVDPGCVKSCPKGAVEVDHEHGNVRTVNEDACKGLRRCIRGCNFQPSRVIWNFEERHAQKCDLCLDTPYWDEEGGPGGKQACIEMCPMKAITFVIEVPEQKADEGYYVNLRGRAWKKMGFPTD